MKADFLVVGAHSAGISTLVQILRQHPAVCLARQDNIHFFDRDRQFMSGSPDFDGYHQFFAPTDKRQLLGESTESYMYWSDSIPRIRDYNPEMKIIAILRDPAVRAYTHWQKNYQFRQDTLSFEEAIHQENFRLSALGINGKHHLFSYLDRGMYANQIQGIFDFFQKRSGSYHQMGNAQKSPASRVLSTL